jgi:hypothetical protein
VCKLLTITGGNATNSELVSELFFHLLEKYPKTIQVNTESNTESNIQSNIELLHFQGTDSYVCCLAHILNLIVQGILAALKAGDY